MYGVSPDLQKNRMLRHVYVWTDKQKRCPPLYLENRTASAGSYTGSADSAAKTGAHPQMKCRTAAAWQYAVKASAGNGPAARRI